MVDKLQAQLPDGWILIKVFNYSSATLVAIREWLENNTEHAYKEVNWRGYCSYSTGVGFEADVDAILFRLRWSK
jgi:hypothetical protein